MKKPKKLRVTFRKNRSKRTRIDNWTQRFEKHDFEEESEISAERIVGGKSELSRRRTVIGKWVDSNEKYGFNIQPEVNNETVLSGRVLCVHGASSIVQTEDGRIFQCVTRRILKTLSTEQRQPIVTGDCVLIRPAKNTVDSVGGVNETANEVVNEAMIERVEPRHGSISRESKHRKHVIVTNVDQILIVASADQPAFKPNLIDRLLLTAEQTGVKPIICINKIDLVDKAELQPIIGVYAQMGYKIILLSAETGFGMERLRQQLIDRESVVTGQSGVGKSSLLNMIDPALNLRVADLGSTQKGQHTTTTTELHHLSFGGFVVDTPGLRQFMLWNIIPEEVFGLFRDLRPYENRCRFPDCTHSHEDDCAVKNAVAEGRLDLRRYESYLAIRYKNC
ncbi:MAG: ribosome small subunit-dependent GTPase A [Planctomycetaceae bacterium]|jgi:ribosome biogenesis GTPase|nr:ribosome small subunit-dependent GTPase A [Planctomycetaceae bacterium]